MHSACFAPALRLHLSCTSVGHKAVAAKRSPARSNSSARAAIYTPLAAQDARTQVHDAGQLPPLPLHAHDSDRHRRTWPHRVPHQRRKRNTDLGKPQVPLAPDPPMLLVGMDPIILGSICLVDRGRRGPSPRASRQLRWLAPAYRSVMGCGCGTHAQHAVWRELCWTSAFVAMPPDLDSGSAGLDRVQSLLRNARCHATVDADRPGEEEINQGFTDVCVMVALSALCMDNGFVGTTRLRFLRWSHILPTSCSRLSHFALLCAIFSQS